jgi:prophage regulatory protein
MITFLRLPEVVARVGLSPMTLWRREHQEPPSFPRRVKLGPNAVGWPKAEIDAWCAARIAERDVRADKEITTEPELAEHPR